ncbi:branched-chain amino acid transport system substrate-binding protein [Sporomusaceae bacterium BoRhaA]|uniref:ABC transporter substrate-binding protein n=1 Tax=Pelorhabdus rhamnosifermentans TaxID=2772457 RepID=UPI001C064117|nr:ABC transporter substrate-binding protein [Pelorhabdus rhamnosifermentans]MBU2700007.1 branched-chain amino acid transport system substrate-binding protein [Pelorhabdus rhamnosifermentans]
MTRSGIKFVGLAICLAIFTGALAGCGSTADSKDIKIGGVFELTGGVASYGQSAVNGAKLAFKQVNASGGVLGKKINFIIADNKSEPSESANAVTKLITQDKVAAIMGAVASSNTLAAVQIATDNKIPLLTPTSTNPKVTVDDNGTVKDYIFRSCFIDPFQGTVMANFATKTLKAKTAVIYVDNSSDYSKGLAQFFEENFVKSGGQVLSKEAFLQKDQDFKATLTKIKSVNPEVIYVPGYYEEVGKIVKQARELGITVPMLGGDGWDSPKLAEIAGKEVLNNSYFSNHYSTEDKDPKVTQFVEDYKAEYNQTPDALAALGYDGAMMLVDAIKRAGSAEPAKIKDALAQTKDLQLVTGLISLDANHNPIKSAVIIELKNGIQTFKEKINP